MNATTVLRSVLLFVAAGLAEIGGGYLVWRAVRNGAGFWVAIAGAVLLVTYGLIPPLQPSAFGRTYAAYGGVFIVLSLLWGWAVDRVRPDVPDVVGGLVCLVGVAVIMYWPRAS
jgi:small multidrug resistance family-3 protein